MSCQRLRTTDIFTNQRVIDSHFEIASMCAYRPVFPNPVPGGTPTLHIFKFLIKHMVQLISLLETPRPDK